MKPEEERHPILRRQLHRLGLSDSGPPSDPATWQRLLESVNRAYIESDQHRHLLERSLAVSSAEMQQLYNDLRASAERLARNVEELARKNSELTKLDEMKTSFISTASHELRTPLTSIRAFSELLADDPALDDTQHEFALAINVESERLARLADNLLDLSRMESEAPHWELRPVDLGAELNRLMRELRPLALRQGIGLRLELQPALPRALADPDGLWQVLLNLADNAFKFTQQGEVVLGVGPSELGICLWVADTGPGIDPADLPHVFAPFYQGGNVLTQKPSGAGLGLAICRQIVHQHGSDLKVESTVGKGTTFSFELRAIPPT